MCVLYVLRVCLVCAYSVCLCACVRVRVSVVCVFCVCVCCVCVHCMLCVVCVVCACVCVLYARAVWEGVRCGGGVKVCGIVLEMGH